MANIKNKRTRKKFKVWTLTDSEKFGSNKYAGAIMKILRKQVEIGRERGEDDTDTYKVIYKTDYEDNRDSVRFFPSAHHYLVRLSPMSISVLFYLSRNALENINIVVLKDREACYRFCNIDIKVSEKLQDETSSLDKEWVNRGNNFLAKKEKKTKVIENIEKEKRTRMARMLRNAIKDLIEKECIYETKVSGHYWINPNILMKGSVGKIPMEYNSYNMDLLDEREKGKLWRYRGREISKEGESYVCFIGGQILDFDSIALAQEYINTIQ